MLAPSTRGYDRIAAGYDRMVERDLWMRQALWRHYCRLFAPGDSVLDIACGTGLDTLFLARHGLRMTGIDASPGMIAELRGKAAKLGIAIDSRVATAHDLHGWPDRSFCGIISGFAGLNTILDVPSFAAEASRLLEARGRLVAHMLAPPDIWTFLELLTRGRWRAARASRRCRERTIVVAGAPMRHILLPARETYERFFASHFRLRGCYSLGFLWPDHWTAQVPPVLASWGGRVEARAGKLRPFLNWGRFFVLDLEKP